MLSLGDRSRRGDWREGDHVRVARRSRPNGSVAVDESGDDATQSQVAPWAEARKAVTICADRVKQRVDKKRAGALALQ